MTTADTRPMEYQLRALVETHENLQAEYKARIAELEVELEVVVGRLALAQQAIRDLEAQATVLREAWEAALTENDRLRAELALADGLLRQAAESAGVTYNSGGRETHAAASELARAATNDWLKRRT